MSFNELADGLAQKEKYRTVLNMVADEKVAHELVNGINRGIVESRSWAASKA